MVNSQIWISESAISQALTHKLANTNLGLALFQLAIGERDKEREMENKKGARERTQRRQREDREKTETIQREDREKTERRLRDRERERDIECQRSSCTLRYAGVM